MPHAQWYFLQENLSHEERLRLKTHKVVQFVDNVDYAEHLWCDGATRFCGQHRHAHYPHSWRDGDSVAGDVVWADL